MRAKLWLIGIGIGLAAGCTVGNEAEPKRATAALEARSGSTVTGIAEFAYTSRMVTLTLTVEGATPGAHGVHMHAVPDCSAPDATSAMGHWNPDMAMHGYPTGTHHLGDCGNIEVGGDGTGVLELEAGWAIGTGEPNDVLDHAVIVHENPDDGTTQMPPGNAGARQACGVIVLAE